MSPSVCLERQFVWLFGKSQTGSADERFVYPDEVAVKLRKRGTAEVETVFGIEISRTHDKGAEKITITELDPS